MAADATACLTAARRLLILIGVTLMACRSDIDRLRDLYRLLNAPPPGTSLDVAFRLSTPVS